MKQVGSQIRKNVPSVIWESQILEQFSDPKQAEAMVFTSHKVKNLSLFLKV